MTQLFNISIGGVDVTDRHSESSISEEVNRAYDIATIHVDDSDTIALNADIVISYGSKVYEGFVYTVSKSEKNKLRIESKSHSAKLTEPYSPSEEVVDDATTSHELVALYQQISGVSISIETAELFFGGSYERTGTMLNALTTITNITGGEIFWSPELQTVKIVQNPKILTSGTLIDEEDIFNFVANSKSVYNQGIGKIIIQNGGSESSDIISQNRIYAEIDECSGEIFVYPNPYGPISDSIGITPLIATAVDKKEDHNVLDYDLIRLDGPIKSVSTVTINGIETDDYSFSVGHNVIYFTTLKRGTITVTYVASAYKGYTNITVTPVGRFISLDLHYLDQILRFQGFLSYECDGSTSSDGDMSCILPSDLSYPKGFDFYTIGGDPEFTVYNKNLIIDRVIISSAVNYVSVEDITLEPLETGGYRYRTRYDIATILGVRSAGVDVGYTAGNDVDGDYIDFSVYYPLLVISYEVTATKHYVQFTDITGGIISLVIRNLNTGETCEYELSGINNDDIDSIPCILNQFVPVNIAEELRIEETEVIGVTLNYTRPDSQIGAVEIDNFGIAKIWVFMDGYYIIDTQSLVARTKVTLKANVAGLL